MNRFYLKRDTDQMNLELTIFWVVLGLLRGRPSLRHSQLAVGKTVLSNANWDGEFIRKTITAPLCAPFRFFHLLSDR